MFFHKKIILYSAIGSNRGCYGIGTNIECSGMGINKGYFVIGNNTGD